MVANSNDAPTLVNAIANQAATEDSAFSFSFAANTFADADVGDTLTYTATLADGSALPSWLSFDAATRSFSGTPLNADVGTLSLKVTANDGNGGTVTNTFDVVVANSNDAPTLVNAIANQRGAETIAFSYQVPSNTFADVDVGDTLTYTATLADGSALPAWLTFNAATRTLSGTPALNQQGTLNIKVTATDGGGLSAQSTFSLLVDPVPPAAVNSVALFATGDENGYLNAGDQLDFLVTFDKEVEITGSPLLGVIIGNSTYYASYTDTDDTHRNMVFSLIVPAGVNDADGVSVTTTAIQLGSATIMSWDGSGAAVLTNTAATYADFKVDTSAPTLSVALQTDTGASNTDGITKSATVLVSGLEVDTGWEYSTDGSTWTAKAANTSTFTLSPGSYAANTIRVRQTDAAGNASVVSISKATTVDMSVPTIVSAVSSWRDLLSAAEVTSSGTVSITTTGVEDGRSVQVTLNGSTNTALVSNNQAVVTIPASVLQALTNGQSYAMTVNVSDVAGNAATALQTTNFTVGLSTADIIRVTPDWGDLLTLAESTLARTVTVVTSGVIDNTTANVVLNNKSYSGLVVSNQVVLNVPQTDINALVDGQSYILTTTVGTGIGPLTNNTTVTQVDKTVPVVSAVALSWGSGLSLSEVASTSNVVTVTTTGMSDGDVVSVSFNAQNGGTTFLQTFTGTVKNNQAVVAVDLANMRLSPTDSSYQVLVVAKDKAGNESAQWNTSSFTVDWLAPVVNSVTSSWGSTLNKDESLVDQTVTITTSGVEDGVLVQLSLDGEFFTAAVLDNQAVVSVPSSALSSLSNKQVYPLAVTVTDRAGNSTVNSVTQFLVSTEVFVENIVLSDVSLRVGESSQVTVTFSEAIYGITDSTCENGSFTGPFISTDGGKTWMNTFTPSANTESAVNTITIAPGYARKLDNLVGTTGRSIGYVVDTKIPVVSISNLSSDVNNNSVISYSEYQAINDNTAALVVTGSYSALEQGRMITVELLSDATGTLIKRYLTQVPATGSGTWSLDIARADLAALAHGNGHTLQAWTTDAAGNDSDRTPLASKKSFVIMNAELGTPIVQKQEINTLTPILTGYATKAQSNAELALDLGDQIVLTVNGQTYTHTVSGSTNPAGFTYDTSTKAWTFVMPGGVLTEGGRYDVLVQVSSDNGNLVKSDVSLEELVIDLSAPTLVIGAIAHDDKLGINEMNTSLTISGIAPLSEVGRTVTISMSKGTPANFDTTAIVKADGQWQVTVPADELSDLDEGTRSITASLTDAAGNTGTLSRTFTVSKERPVVESVTAGWGGVLSGPEIAAASSVTVATTGAEDGSTVSIVIDGKTYSGTVTTNSATIDIDADAMDGVENSLSYTIDAVVYNLAGNASNTHSSTTFTVDTLAPTVVNIVSSWSTTMTDAEQQKAGTVKVESSSTEVGQDLTLVLNGVTYSATSTTGTTTFTIPVADMSALLTGESYTMSAYVSDAQGNTSASTDSMFVVDNASPALSRTTASYTLTDNFSAPDSRWVFPSQNYLNKTNTAKVRTSEVGNPALQLTLNSDNQYGFTYLDQAFSATSVVNIRFSFKLPGVAADNGDVGDGFAMFLFDGSLSANQVSGGLTGGSFGYYGMSNGYLGIGFDEYNSTLASDAIHLLKSTYSTDLKANELSARLISKNLSTLPLGYSNFGPDYRRYAEINLDNGQLTMSMLKNGGDVSKSSDWVKVIQGYNVATSNFTSFSSLKLGFSGATAGAEDAYSFDDVQVAVRDTFFYEYGNSGARLALDKAWTVADTDSTGFAELAVKFTTGTSMGVSTTYVSGQDSLELDASVSALATTVWDTNTGTLTATATSGSWTAAEAQTVLAAVRYANQSTTPTSTTLERHVQYALTDVEGASSDLHTSAIKLVADTFPTVKSVTFVSATTSAGHNYTKAIDTGDVLTYTVNFSEEVALVGTANLSLYFSGSNTTRTAVASNQTGRSIQFTYTVQDTDFDADGVTIVANALSLSGGATLKDTRVGTQTASLSNSAVTSGGPQIDTIQMGTQKLIRGYQNAGQWYYYYDMNGDGLTNDTPWHTDLNGIFKYDATLLSTDQNGKTTSEYHYGTKESVAMSLPTLGVPFPFHSLPAGQTITGTSANTFYSDAAGLWDLFAAQGAAYGLPTGWNSASYWLADTNQPGTHVVFNYATGTYYPNSESDQKGYHAAVQVLGDRPMTRLSSVSFVGATTQSGGNPNVVDTGDVLTYKVSFTEDVILTGTAQLALTFSGNASGSQTRYATATNQIGKDLYFTYTVQSTDYDHDGVVLAANQLSMVSTATVRDKDLQLFVRDFSHDALADKGALIDALSLGTDNGLLVKGYQVEGKWYYYWDRNGDGVTFDTVSHNVLDSTFKLGNDFVSTNPASDGTIDYRYAVMSGTKLALPTLGVHTPHTTTQAAQTIANTSGNNMASPNAMYDNMAALWDATATANGANGTPQGWRTTTNTTNLNYWLAETYASASHTMISLGDGTYIARVGDATAYNVALQMVL